MIGSPRRACIRVGRWVTVQYSLPALKETWILGRPNTWYDITQGGPRLTVSRARLFFAHNSRATYSYISANK